MYSSYHSLSVSIILRDIFGANILRLIICTLKISDRFSGEIMHCAIYKGRNKIDHYLYVEKEDDFSKVPDALLTILGRLELVMTLELSPERTLAQADINQVRESLREQGYYFQMPPQTREPPANA